LQPELTEILTSVLETGSVSEQDSADTIPSWDSVRHLTLITAIEERFNVTFDADQLMELTSVAAILEALRKSGHA
jgi:acyl carrier protein